MNTYDIGDLIRLSAAFDVSGPTDPTTLVFEIREPDGTTTTHTYGVGVEIVRDSLGRFHLDWSADLPGLHLYRVAGTGAAQAVEQGAFRVIEDEF